MTMNSTTMDIRPYRLALQTPYRWSKGTQYHRSGLILRFAHDGQVGWGEAALPPHVDYPPDDFARECRALMAGLDPLADDFLTELDLRECPARLRCGMGADVAGGASRPAAGGLFAGRRPTHAGACAGQ